ncbi:MAG: NAD-dependent epimerase/dehydratase family protein [Syntrophales bacterium]
MQKLLITGTGGFIGGFLVEEAIKKGYHVVAGVRKTSDRIIHPSISFIELDYEKPDSIAKSIEKEHFKFVIHNGGVTNSRHENEYFLCNYVYTRNLVDALQKTDCPPEKFIYTSSLASYGPGKTSLTPIQMTDKQSPITFYGKSKLEAENYLRSLTDFPYLILRPTVVYGPRERNLYVVFNLLNRHIEVKFVKNRQALSFVYVKDLVDCFLKALESELKQKSYFVSDGKHLNRKTIKITVPTFILKPAVHVNEAIARITGNAPIFDMDRLHELQSPNWSCNIDETIVDLKYEPKYNLDKGIAETIIWYHCCPE